MLYLFQLLERAWMSFVHDVWGMRSCPGGLGVRDKRVKLKDVDWGYQGLCDVIDTLSQEALSGYRMGSGRIGGVLKCHGFTGAFPA